MSVTLKSVKNYKPICHAILFTCLASLVINMYFMYLIANTNKPQIMHFDVEPQGQFHDEEHIKFNTNTEYGPSNYSYDDEMRENMRDYQLQFLDNGDVAIYDGHRLVDVLHYNTTCALHKALDRDND